MIGTTHRWSILGLGLLLSVGGARPAIAQWTSTAYGVAQFDTKNTGLLLAGVTASPKTMGLVPVLGLQAYWLGYDNGPGHTNVFTVRPGVGLGYNYTGGQLLGTIGYAFSNTSTSVSRPLVGAASGRGVDVDGEWDHWGTGAGLGYQALADYNFGGKSFWGRGRVTTRLSQHGASSTRAGAELAYLSGPGYDAWQPGGVLEFHMPGGQILGLGAGVTLPNVGDKAVYFKVEGVLPLVR